MEEVEEISTEEKLQIAQHYLLSSPPGQFHEVLNDIRKIIPVEILSESLANGIARVANVKQCKVVTSPSGKKVVLCQSGEVDPTHYIDSVNKTVFLIDHLTLATHEDSSLLYKIENETKESIRCSLQVALNNYISKCYLNENSAAGAFLQTDNNNKIDIIITGEKANLKNFWSGRWNSTWCIDFDDSNQVAITGDIKIHVHYFEDGNLQLQSSKNIPSTTLVYNSDSDLVEQILKVIQSQESLLQSSLEDMYTNMNQETFRSMRRLMPITRTKMEWNVNAIRMVKQVRK